MDSKPKIPRPSIRKYEELPEDNYRVPDTPRRQVGRPGSGETSATTFNNYHEEIYKAFKNGRTCIQVAQLFKVSRQAAHIWHKSWLAWIDFADEPPIIKEMKREAEKIVKINTQQSVMKEKHIKAMVTRSHTEVDKLRLRFMDIANASLDRIEELIAQEKGVGNLAKLLGAVLPYVATKQDGDSGKGLTPDEKRTAFIQNVMNVYNISTQKQIQDGTTEDSESEWTPAE